MKRTKKTNFKFSYYIYLLNNLLIITVLWLKFLDIYYTLILIENEQVTETVAISRFLLNFGPIVVYLVSLLPIFAFFIVNYFIRKNVIYLTFFSIVLIVLILYLVPIVQNSLNVIELLNGG